jgi:DNA-binding LacI/PurR family transcriptional regulator
LVKTLRPAGVIDLGGLSDDDIGFMESAGCPVVPRERLDLNSCIGRLQARHLHSRGYTEIAYAFLSDARDDQYGQERARAVTDFCLAQGLAPPAHLSVPIEPEGARRELARLVESCGRPVGIACYNDVVAVALVFAAGRLGLAVPGGVAVVGAEGVDVGQVVSPRLTTVVSDVSAVLRQVRDALARTYQGLGSPGEIPPPEDSFTLLAGETT